MQHHEGISEAVVYGEILEGGDGGHSLLLHFAMLDGLAIEDLGEPIEDWMQNEGPNLYS